MKVSRAKTYKRYIIFDVKSRHEGSVFEWPMRSCTKTARQFT